jgi:hypothetical protein
VFFGDDGAGLDLGDKVAITYDGPAEDTATGNGVHINWSAQAFFVYRVDLRQDPVNKIAKCTLTLEADN